MQFKHIVDLIIATRSYLEKLKFKFRVNGLKGLQKGHRLHVKCTLDDQQADNIDKEVRIIEIRDDHYGCEFLNLAYEEKELGYYIFPS